MMETTENCSCSSSPHDKCAVVVKDCTLQRFGEVITPHIPSGTVHDTQITLVGSRREPKESASAVGHFITKQFLRLAFCRTMQCFVALPFSRIHNLDNLEWRHACVH